MKPEIIFNEFERNLIKVLIKIKKKEEKIYIVGDSTRKLIKGQYIETLTFCCKNINLEKLLKNYTKELEKKNIAKITKNITKNKIRSKSYLNLPFFTFSIKNEKKVLKMSFRDLLNESLDEDLITRDFTFNALYYDIDTKKIYDPCKEGVLALLENRLKIINNFEITFEESYNANCRYLRLIKILTEENEIIIDEKIKDYFINCDYEILFNENLKRFDMLIKQINKMSYLGNPVLVWNFLYDFKIFEIMNPFFIENFNKKFLDSLNKLKNLKDCIEMENFNYIFPKFVNYSKKDILIKVFYFPFINIFFENKQLDFFLTKTNLLKFTEKEKIKKFIEIIEKNFIDKNYLEKLSKIILNSENKNFLDIFFLILIKFKNFDEMKNLINYFIINKKSIYQNIWKKKLSNLIKKKFSIKFFEYFWKINPTCYNNKPSLLINKEFNENIFSKFFLKKKKKKINLIKKYFYHEKNINSQEIENLFLIADKLIYLEDNSQKEINEKNYFLKSKRFELLNYVIFVLKERTNYE